MVCLPIFNICHHLYEMTNGLNDCSQCWLLLSLRREFGSCSALSTLKRLRNLISPPLRDLLLFFCRLLYFVWRKGREDPLSLSLFCPASLFQRSVFLFLPLVFRVVMHSSPWPSHLAWEKHSPTQKHNCSQIHKY